MQTLRVTLTTDQTAKVLIDAIAAYPMGLVAHIDGQANCAKRGIEVAPDQILEVFRPDFARRVWQADKAAGIDIPLRIHLYQADDATHVSFRTPHEVFAAYGNADLNRIAAELTPIFDSIFAALSPYLEKASA